MTEKDLSPQVSFEVGSFNQFAQGLFLVFLNRCTGLFLAKNPKIFLAINPFASEAVYTRNFFSDHLSDSV